MSANNTTNAAPDAIPDDVRHHNIIAATECAAAPASCSTSGMATVPVGSAAATTLRLTLTSAVHLAPFPESPNSAAQQSSQENVVNTAAGQTVTNVGLTDANASEEPGSPSSGFLTPTSIQTPIGAVKQPCTAMAEVHNNPEYLVSSAVLTAALPPADKPLLLAPLTAAALLTLDGLRGCKIVLLDDMGWYRFKGLSGAVAVTMVSDCEHGEKTAYFPALRAAAAPPPNAKQVTTADNVDNGSCTPVPHGNGLRRRSLSQSQVDVIARAAADELTRGGNVEKQAVTPSTIENRRYSGKQVNVEPTVTEGDEEDALAMLHRRYSQSYLGGNTEISATKQRNQSVADIGESEECGSVSSGSTRISLSTMTVHQHPTALKQRQADVAFENDADTSVEETTEQRLPLALEVGASLRGIFGQFKEAVVRRISGDAQFATPTERRASVLLSRATAAAVSAAALNTPAANHAFLRAQVMTQSLEPPISHQNIHSDDEDSDEEDADDNDGETVDDAEKERLLREFWFDDAYYENAREHMLGLENDDNVSEDHVLDETTEADVYHDVTQVQRSAQVPFKSIQRQLSRRSVTSEVSVESEDEPYPNRCLTVIQHNNAAHPA